MSPGLLLTVLVHLQAAAAPGPPAAPVPGEVLHEVLRELAAGVERPQAVAADFAAPSFEVVAEQEILPALHIERLRCGPLLHGESAFAAWRELLRWVGASATGELRPLGARDGYPGGSVRWTLSGRQGGHARLLQIEGSLAFAGGRWAGLRVHEALRAQWRGGRFADRSARLLADCAEAREQLRPGLDFYLRRLDRRSGVGRAGAGCLLVADLDGDGREDLYVGQPGGLPNRALVRREDGTFADRSAELGLAILDATASALAVDLDADAAPELVLGGESLLLLRRRAGTFEWQPEAGLTLPDSCAGVITSIRAADLEGDGDPDLFVTTAPAATGEVVGELAFPLTQASNGTANFLFRNRGGLRFEEVLAAHGLGGGNDRHSRASLFEDLDGDARVDLYVANDHGPDQYYRGQPDGTFALVLGGEAWQPRRSRWLARWPVPAGVPAALWLGSGASAALEETLASTPRPPGVSRRTWNDLQGLASSGGLLRLEDGVWQRDSAPPDGEAVAGLCADLLGLGSPQVLSLTGLRDGPLPDVAPRWWRDAVQEAARSGLSEQEAGERWRAVEAALRQGGSFAGEEPDHLWWRHAGTWMDLAGLVGLEQLGNGRAAVRMGEELVVLRRDAPGLMVMEWEEGGEQEQEQEQEPAEEPAHAQEHARAVAVAVGVMGGVVAPRWVARNAAGAEVEVGLPAGRSLRLFVAERCEESTWSAWRGSAASELHELLWVPLDAAVGADLAVLLDFLLETHAGAGAGITLQVSAEGWLEGMAQGGAPHEVRFGGLEDHLDGRWLAPRRRTAHSLLARAYREAGRLPQALHVLAHVHPAAGPDADAPLERGLAELAAGRPALALAALRQVPDQHPRRVEAWRARGEAHRQLGELPAALTWLGRALELSPLDGVARRGRALAYRASGDIPAASEDLRVAAILQPADAALQMLLGELLEEEGFREEAGVAFARAAALLPGRAEPLVRAALLELAAGRLAEGEALLQRARQVEPAAARPCFELANLMLERKELARAQELAEEARRRAPDLPAIQQLLRRIQEERDGSPP